MRGEGGGVYSRFPLLLFGVCRQFSLQCFSHFLTSDKCCRFPGPLPLSHGLPKMPKLTRRFPTISEDDSNPSEDCRRWPEYFRDYRKSPEVLRKVLNWLEGQWIFPIVSRRLPKTTYFYVLFPCFQATTDSFATEKSLKEIQVTTSWKYNFSLQYQYIFKQTDDENKENYQQGDNVMMHNQILTANIKRNV